MTLQLVLLRSSLLCRLSFFPLPLKKDLLLSFLYSSPFAYLSYYVCLGSSRLQLPPGSTSLQDPLTAAC